MAGGGLLAGGSPCQGGVSFTSGGLLARGVCLPEGGLLAGGGGSDRAPHGQNSWHMLLKILPCPNFVVGGNDSESTFPSNYERDENFFYELGSPLFHILLVCINLLFLDSKSIFVSQMEFDETKWACSWNSDQNCTQKTLPGDWVGIGLQGVVGVQPVGWVGG